MRRAAAAPSSSPCAARDAPEPSPENTTTRPNPLPPRSEEFKRHKAADAKFVRAFFAEWSAYAAQVEQQSVAAGELGAPLDAALADALSDEQRAQLEKLRVEAEKASWH